MHFHEKFRDILRRRLKADRRHTSGHRSPRTPLRNSGLHLWLAVPFRPLGGAKRISLTLDISAISEPIGAIFHRTVRLVGGYRSPHRICGYRFRFGGQPPKTNFFSIVS